MKSTRQTAQAVWLVLLLVGLPSLTCAQTPASCNVPIGTDIVFDDNLWCLSQNGLVITADGITIDLNGKTLGCWNGTNLGCQNLSVIGINTNGHSNVVIKNGTVYGFAPGILVDGGDDPVRYKATIELLTVTGPGPITPLYNGRADNVTGILVQNVKCPGAVIIDGNDVSHHRHGIRLESAECVKIQGNTIQRNNSAMGESFGIRLFNSARNTITNNTVSHNGINITTTNNSLRDAGVALEGPLTSNNRVARNTALLNCGDGISVRNGANGNAVSGNYAREHPAGPDDPNGRLCYSFTLGYHDPLDWCPGSNCDLTERGEGVGNRWGKNNDCQTSLGIPSGICSITY